MWLCKAENGYGIVALSDSNSDHIADMILRFVKFVGTGMKVHKHYLYFGADTTMVRYPFVGNDLLCRQKAESIVQGVADQRQHRAKPIAFDHQSNLYVNIGAPSNACQEELRTPGSPGLDPCPQLQRHGGI